jgi:hypothetical protein
VNEAKAYGSIAIAEQLREAILELRGEDIKRVLLERLDLGKSARKRLRTELGNGQHAAPVAVQEEVTIRLLLVVESMRGGPDPNHRQPGRDRLASEIMVVESSVQTMISALAKISGKVPGPAER